MSERNESMAKLLAADAPPERDALFALAVMARIEERRFAGVVARNLGAAAVAVLVLASLTPVLDPVPALIGDWTRILMPFTDRLVVVTLLLSAGFAAWQARLARAG